ncbi:sigma-54 dependent transcriptional regulator [Stieleria sp. JC731]|uniref:sigma-54-dependent transcriptional regulator n=1 Tax=Pirellulaceae TaxID=2691357 RepID=UPI001E636D47|nr:sigma-54 dependent transcriptional regulator [Stieleria sp. JC731]MCC9601734.1 sigma-54 dependent transcriptional regulator [Stieleria sp. JC731]
MNDSPIKLLLVEDEDDIRESCARWMQRKGHLVSTASSGAEALSLCEQKSFDVAVFDMNMPGMSGIELLQRVNQQKIEMEVIILTGQGTIESAVAAMKMGACDFLTKPCSLGDLEHHCVLARDRGNLRRENQQLKAIISRSKPAVDLVGDSPSMQHVLKMIYKVAPTDKPVLILGESGTGKEVVARAIQQNSPLADKPFVTINCAALPEQLVESELFGHQKGSFTGATADKPGLFEIADGGTLFIDELGELPLSLQPKLLRVLEDGSMRRIGSHKERTVKVRIIAATNRNLADEVESGRFREDLYYRINVLSLDLPPLRDRPGDIDRLIDHHLPIPWHIDDAARDALNRYHWPGNIRQLINVIQRATILADGNDITPDDLPSEVVRVLDGEINHDPRLNGKASHNGADSSATSVELPDSLKLDDVAKHHVLRVLDLQNGNKAKAARVLGIHRRKLYRLLERFANNEAKDNQTATSTVDA